MTLITTDSQHYTDIASAIRTQLGVQTTYLPSEMAAAILSISGGGGGGGADPSTVTWTNGSWADIADVLSQHYAGTIDLTNYWNVGDTRSVSLAAMSATGVNESHVAQTVELVIMAKKHYDKSDGSGKAAFVIGQKNLLSDGDSGENGNMNSSNTNSGGWDSCARRTWCNSTYKNALPSELQSLLKQVDIVTADGSSTTTATSADYVFLPAEKEVYGTNSYANSTAEASLSQYAWYATPGNRIKGAGAFYWWERSPHNSNSKNFCCVNSSNGSADWTTASSGVGILPHFCI